MESSVKFETGLNLKPKRLVSAFVAALVLGLAGCASVPGDNREEQVQTIDELVDTTLVDLYKQDPTTEAKIASSVGYVIMNNKITKIPLVGAGAGYGVAINPETKERTYLKMARFDVGGGWGVKSVRPVLIFTNKKLFKNFIKGDWSVNAGVDAAAKVGDAGVAGTVGSDSVGNDKGYTIHMITDAGVAATVTAGVIRVSPISLKK
jgi:lipid-binding SYLF domain-containing protein